MLPGLERVIGTDKERIKGGILTSVDCCCWSRNSPVPAGDACDPNPERKAAGWGGGSQTMSKGLDRSHGRGVHGSAGDDYDPNRERTNERKAGKIVGSRCLGRMTAMCQMRAGGVMHAWGLGRVRLGEMDWGDAGGKR